jgi:hypothetical protein
MDVAELLAELFGRVDEHISEILDDLEPSLLDEPPEEGSNPIGWLVWHITRVTDAHIAEILEVDQQWAADGWADRFGRDPDPSDVGFGHTTEQVAAFRSGSASLLADYWAAVWERTQGVLGSTTAEELDRIVDRRWDPPVTLGVRLVSIADDAVQHSGQAAYAKGMLQRR